MLGVHWAALAGCCPPIHPPLRLSPPTSPPQKLHSRRHSVRATASCTHPPAHPGETGRLVGTVAWQPADARLPSLTGRAAAARGFPSDPGNRALATMRRPRANHAPTVHALTVRCTACRPCHPLQGAGRRRLPAAAARQCHAHAQAGVHKGNDVQGRGGRRPPVCAGRQPGLHTRESGRLRYLETHVSTTSIAALLAHVSIAP